MEKLLSNAVNYFDVNDENIMPRGFYFMGHNKSTFGDFFYFKVSPSQKGWEAINLYRGESRVFVPDETRSLSAVSLSEVKRFLAHYQLNCMIRMSEIESEMKEN